MRFAGRSVLVTGAGSGIGRATARLFAAEGSRVVAVDRDAAVEALAGEHDAIRPMIGDAGDEDNVRAMVDAALAHGGGVLDVVAANAGILGGLPSLFEQDAATFAEVLRVNLIGPFLAIKHGGRPMASRGRGAIVCTASVAGLRAGAGGIAYSASKAGVINLVQSAAQQLSGTGVRVNAVCPGLIETGMTRFVYERARETGKADQIGQLNPLQRGGEPEEIAAAIAFLASDAASYVNGQALAVDGGLSSSHPFTRPPRAGRPAL